VSGGVADAPAQELVANGPLGRLVVALFDRLDRVLLVAAAIAAVMGALVLTESVVVRYLLKQSTDWQDETTVFLLVGSTFLSAPYVQSIRGHVAIEALSEILPAGVNRWRVALVDLVSLVFCAFFAWKSWTLFEEAWVDGQTTSSSWGPPLWIPYVTMATGMTLLALRIALQAWLGLGGGKRS
jgi:TRAP-type C4-dicarboxylate transport system permease small subunit